MPACVLGRCDGSGFIIDEASNTAYDCPCRPQMAARATARSLSATIPRRYRDLSFDRVSSWEFEPQATFRAVREYAARIDHHLDRGHGLWLMGTPGNGKTTLAMLVSRAALQAGRSVAIYSLPRLLNEIRDNYRTERSHTALLDRLTAVDLLHIDDVGAERSNDWVLEELYSIVNSRYEEQRSIVITTNLNQEQLTEQIHERTVSRLTEMCDELLLAGPDQRHEPRGDRGRESGPPALRGGLEPQPRAFGDGFGGFDDAATPAGTPQGDATDDGAGRSSFGELWHDYRR